MVLGERTSVWPERASAATTSPSIVGAETNIQDNAVLHNDVGFPLTIGEGVSVGHQAMLHGCTIGAGALIGIQSVVMNKVSIGDDCLVGAGTIVPGREKTFEARSADPRRARQGCYAQLTDKDVEMLRFNTADYVRRRQRYPDTLKSRVAPQAGNSGATSSRSRRGAPGRAPSTSNSALKLPSPKPSSPLRWMNSKNTGPSSVCEKICSSRRLLAALRRAVEQDAARLQLGSALAMPGQPLGEHLVVRRRRRRHQRHAGASQAVDGLASRSSVRAARCAGCPRR